MCDCGIGLCSAQGTYNAVTGNKRGWSGSQVRLTRLELTIYRTEHFRPLAPNPSTLDPAGAKAKSTAKAGARAKSTAWLGTTVWTACSGDSRAVLGYVRDGAIRARDHSVDCKPDSPEEYERIVGAGGVVSGASGASPARVWADGRVGLAMSRSIGDGECKRFGVIPDPEIKRFDLGAAPANTPEADGDRFIIVASDGVWEFIDSQAERPTARGGLTPEECSISSKPAAAS
ncbi:hypothetical protein EMIHUDRAFT_227254 [Emiliania huxleyi CCMP1516]|uniref:PPM-type phosphatase domain-containing protein n=2 Tax=Emiliania huxleyi TaxID=2903 RepID=A0A0D3KJ02_EMIH1|nr:hypothetical protein EMIHUDRAFT_227254 [Emiliania huxleyi CCMP1516]EOD35737.1 hypothetical protein EMIHUDRAFT_227254 [Emiliania huxleyi CCMP1516]|eukprot:XP_005788166.1 hypothetical protein EMIHUDRAFT_227254 [Emiliania huxleyi CCMP1516]